MEFALSFIVGIGLAASCGFRVFVPLLVISMATKAGFVQPAEGFAWIGQWPALLAFSVATVAEIGAYYIPWLDNLLDAIASPAALVAGTVLMAASVADVHPLLQWSLAIIAGGGSAGVVQMGMVATRAASTGTTGGLANFVVATFENVSSLLFSVLSLIAPVIAIVLLLGVVAGAYYVGSGVLRRWLFKTPSATRKGPQ